MNTKKFWGNAFMVLGGGIALLAGGCAVIFEFMAFGQSSGERYLTPMLPLIIGGVPALVGVGLFFLGRKLKKSAVDKELAVPFPPERPTSPP